MIKELFLAIILGALLGFGLTGGYYSITKKNTPPVSSIITPSPTSPTTSPTPSIAQTTQEIIIAEPENNSIVSSPKTIITGSATPDSYIIINTPIKTYDSKSDTEGNFSVSVDLAPDINQIHITVIDSNDTQTDTLLYITYSTAKFSFKFVKPCFAATEVNPETIKQQVMDRLEAIKNKPEKSLKKGLIGTITSITDNTIVMELDNTKYTISTTEDTTFLNTKRNKTTIDKFKVGQDILVLGNIDKDNSALCTAVRIIQTDIKSIKRLHQVVVGKIVDISKSSPIIVVIPTNNKNTQFQIKLESEPKDLKVGQKVIVSIIPDPKVAKTYTALKLLSL